MLTSLNLKSNYFIYLFYSLKFKESRKYGEEIVYLESCLLQTLGFNVLINHAHTFIIKTCQMIKGKNKKPNFPKFQIKIFKFFSVFF